MEQKAQGRPTGTANRKRCIASDTKQSSTKSKGRPCQPSVTPSMMTNAFRGFFFSSRVFEKTQGRVEMKLLRPVIGQEDLLTHVPVTGQHRRNQPAADPLPLVCGVHQNVLDIGDAGIIRDGARKPYEQIPLPGCHDEIGPLDSSRQPASITGICRPADRLLQGTERGFFHLFGGLDSNGCRVKWSA